MKTAVEFLAISLKNHPHIKHSFRFKELVKQAKEMEKEQIVNAYKEGCSDGGFFDEKWDEERAEEYYGETYTNPDRV